MGQIVIRCRPPPPAHFKLRFRRATTRHRGRGGRYRGNSSVRPGQRRAGGIVRCGYDDVLGEVGIGEVVGKIAVCGYSPGGRGNCLNYLCWCKTVRERSVALNCNIVVDAKSPPDIAIVVFSWATCSVRPVRFRMSKCRLLLAKSWGSMSTVLFLSLISKNSTPPQ